MLVLLYWCAVFGCIIELRRHARGLVMRGAVEHFTPCALHWLDIVSHSLSVSGMCRRFREILDMTVPVGAIIRASARWHNYNGDDVVNVFYFRGDFTSAQDEQDVFDAVDAYLTSVYTEFDGYIDNNAVPYDLKVDVVEFTGGKWKVTQNVLQGSWGATLTPAETGDVLPPQTAALVKLETGLGKHQGSKYFGMFGESQNSANGGLTTTLLNALLDGAVKLLTAYVFGGTEELQAVVLDTVTGVVRDVIGVSCSYNWSGQRRRRPGTGS